METRGRKKTWNNPIVISVKTETYLKEALEEDPDVKKCTNLVQFFNKLIIKFLGDNNHAVQQFREEHPSYT
jgi:hypothetical protein